MQQKNKKATCWIITEGLAGTENQCLGVAESLGLAPEVKRITLKNPWKAFSPHLSFEHAGIFTPALAPPWPDLLITSGRKAVAAARFIKRASGGKTFTLHIQDPRISPRYFDLLAVPAHDPARGDNVIVTTAAPNRITPEKLEGAREAFEHFQSLPAPRVAVLIGGNSKAYTMTPDITRELAEQLKNLNASLMVTTSRRTGAENESILRTALSGKPHTFFWDGHGENPYFGMLGWANFILVTADSASMLSEAATTGKPVYMIDLKGGAKRLNALQENLITHGAVRRFDGVLEHWSYTPLHDAEKVAAAVRERLGWI